MLNILQKSLTYLIGGLVGLSVVFIARQFNVPYFSDDPCANIFVVFVLLGILTSMALTGIKDKKELQKNNKLRNESVALITHEMKTGLTSTGWILDILLDKYGIHFVEDDKIMVKNAIDSIHTTVMHSVNLLDVSLMDISKLSISLDWRSLDEVKKVLEETLGKYVSGAKKKGIVLVSNIDLDKSKLVEVDLTRLNIILENLIANAIQYAREDKKEIFVKIFNTEKDLKIEVKDNGIGIPDEEQGKIFSEFYRASNARKKVPTSTGIGLYMTKKYITAHRGEIYFKSKLNEGTTFFISIPLKTSEDVNKFLKQI